MATLEIIGAPQSKLVWTTRIACAGKRVPYTLNPARPHTGPARPSVRQTLPPPMPGRS
jgi:hypothetical protein